MQKVQFKNLSIYEPRLDWISVVGDIPHIDREAEEQMILLFMSSIGFHKMEKRDRLTYRSNIFGIEIAFGRKRNTGVRFLKIEFQGQFFADSLENCDVKIKSFVALIWQTFGVQSPPKITRIDIATDILNISHKDLFPDFSDKKYQIITNSKQSPKFSHSKHYSDQNNPSEETGISVFNSRFEFALYERLLKLDQYSKIPHKRGYVDYYRGLYQGASKVLRIEIRLKKELCEYFNIAYFLELKPLPEIIKKTLAFFNHHHRIKDIEENEFLSSIDKLFFRDEYESIKTLKISNNIGLDLDKLHFSNPYADINPALTFIARTQIACGRTSNADLTEILLSLKKKIHKEVENVEDKFIQQKRTQELFYFDKEQQEAFAEKFHEFSIKLKSIKEENPENIHSMIDYLKIAPFINKINEFDPNKKEEENDSEQAKDN